MEFANLPMESHHGTTIVGNFELFVQTTRYKFKLLFPGRLSRNAALSSDVRRWGGARDPSPTASEQ